MWLRNSFFGDQKIFLTQIFDKNFLFKRPSTQREGHWLEAFIDLRWTQELFGLLMTDFCLNASSGSHLGLTTPRQLYLMINNDSPLNWSKLFQLRNLLHNANASFFIFSLQWFSFSILVFFLFVEYSIWSLIYLHSLPINLSLIHLHKKMILEKNSQSV